ncbi:MAG: DUF2939 domain-containing protein [Hyphomicrobiaceae bacterium]|nr:DUF2939 domain-containing protein [Hyphomicrobiaceae bacterium]
MRPRRLLTALMLSLAVVAAGYALSPLRAIWDLHSAIKAGDTATVAQRVDWTKVRASLRRSIAAHAHITPFPPAGNLSAQPRRTLWARLKAHFGGKLLDRFLARYITPQGLIDLDRLGRHGRGAVVRAGLTGGGTRAVRADLVVATEQSWWAKAQALLSRIRSAGYCSLTCFGVRIADKKNADRHYAVRFEWVGTTWVMTSVEVLGLEGAEPLLARNS